MVYKPLKVELDSTKGIHFSLRAMRLPKNQNRSTTMMEDIALASKLIKAGPDHAKFQRGIMAYIRMEMQTGFMIEFETYRHGVECLSTSSSMHNELVDLRGDELANQKQLDLPNKVYKRDVVISYQALRSMYKARRHHKHPDWQIFCDFIETLPYFKYLIVPEAQVDQ